MLCSDTMLKYATFLRYLNIGLGQARDVHVKNVLLGSLQNVDRDDGVTFVVAGLVRPRRKHDFLDGVWEMEDVIHRRRQVPVEVHSSAHFPGSQTNRFLRIQTRQLAEESGRTELGSYVRSEEVQKISSGKRER